MVLMLPTDSARKWHGHELELIEVVTDQEEIDYIVEQIMENREERACFLNDLPPVEFCCVIANFECWVEDDDSEKRFVAFKMVNVLIEVCRSHECVFRARFFNKGIGKAIFGYNSSRDSEGHGRHSASTAAGHEVPNANLLGYAAGIACGIAPKARIAVYKICWHKNCALADILTGYDEAVEDSVDIISYSVGGEPDFI